MSNRKIHGRIDKGLYFKSRKEAEQFIKSMSEISDTYGFIFCADVLDYFNEDCEISHDRYGWFDVRKWFVHFVGTLTPYIDYSYRVQLDRPVYYSEETNLKTTEVGPAWDGFRAGAAEAECEIHGGLVTIGPELPWDENKFKKHYEEWIKKNPHTDVSTLYPKTHFISSTLNFPGRSGGKVLFTKAWMNAMYGTPMYSIKNVIFNEPATIVFWSDGTKTVVKTQDGEQFDPEKGLAMAISKKALGNKREYYHTFLHWLKKYEKDNVVTEQLCKGVIDKLTKNIYELKFTPMSDFKKEAVEIQKRLYEELGIVTDKKHAAVQKAYDLLVKYGATEGDMILNEVIGYLGQALED